MRCCAAVAYLHPALPRPNLTVIPRTFVPRVLFEGGRAAASSPSRRRADRPGAASGGASCAAARTSRRSSCCCPASVRATSSTASASTWSSTCPRSAATSRTTSAGIILSHRRPDDARRTAETEENVALLQTQGRGPLTSNVAESGGFWRSRTGIEAPDIQFHFAPVIFVDEGLLEPFDHAYSYGASVVKPSRAGASRWRSADPADKPRILANFLGTDEDWAVPVAGIRKLPGDPRPSPLTRYERAPYDVPDSDDEDAIRAHVRAKATTSTTRSAPARWAGSSTRSCASRASRGCAWSTPR